MCCLSWRYSRSQPPLTLESQLDEDRVRRALGLKTNGATHQQRPEQARQRHRFVSDGAVFVTQGCYEPTLTIMAISARSADYIAHESSKGSL